MKFSDMKYERPDGEALKEHLKALTEALKQADSFEAAEKVFLEHDTAEREVNGQICLASVRHTIDTRDEFYDAEDTFWNEYLPELEEYEQAFTAALLETPFRPELEKKYGSLIFVNAEIARKTFSPDIIPEMQQENELTQTYSKLLANARVSFEGKEYTIPQMGIFKVDPDDARRLAAWKAEGSWYKEHQAELDRIYDELVKLRDTMGKKLGYEGYTTLGYYRMTRNCYTKEDVERFRAAVVKYLVPVADELMRQQAKRLGVSYPLSFADAALEFRSGNPKPVGTSREILEHGREFYDSLSPETSAFFRAMLDNDLLDVDSKEGKAGGGYCTDLGSFGMPFIVANFNGTQGDVEVVTHEAGHAFACYLNLHRVPYQTTWPSMEACEVHSMSMEFFGEAFAEVFFGRDAAKFRLSHLAGAIEFIPYGTMVDHFQHIMYEKPEMTPAERHAVWKELLGIYMPWLRLDGDIPFYAEGEGWQRQQHIYNHPFYYIDYVLASVVAMQFKV